MTTLLATLAGAWSGPEQLAPSPWSPGGPAHGRHVFTPALDGKALLHDYAGGLGLTGHGVWMREPENEVLLWWWVDSIGFPPPGPSRGDAAGDAELVLTKETPRGIQRVTFAVDDATLHHTIEVRLAGEAGFQTLVTATYARETEAAPARTTVPASTAQSAPASKNTNSTPAS